MRIAKRSAVLRGLVGVLCFLATLEIALPRALAGVPRFVSGRGWGVPPSWSVVWQGTTLFYYTDAGDLGPNVSHAEADQMVAAAANVWNVAPSSISIAQGGQLQEDVSLQNTFFDGQKIVFPKDVQLGSERAFPVAILYDATGELIDLLLGAGASDPSGCRQNAVAGDIDDIHQNDGSIHHATLILNGRCVGSAPEQLTQMQYQLVRAFGRILGLSWSQVNDNVFTGQTTVTASQVAHWPVMHPLDLICSNYSYQCLSDPFTLRDEDLNTLALLYPVPMSNVPNGKQGSSDDAVYLWGIYYFPSGQGMGWTNITVHRLNNGVLEDWQTTSALTGYQFLQSTSTPLRPDPPTSTGNSNPGLDGYFLFRRVPCNGVSDLFFTTEPINPLYTGDAAIGPYIRPPVTPSGSATTFVDYSAFSYGDNQTNALVTADDATSTCDSSGNGSEQSPVIPDASGWQVGHLCAWNTNTWWKTTIAARHSWTLEVTATDETGAATGNKLQPVLGAWHGGDPTGSLPTVISQPVPFNSLSMGMTQLRMNAVAAAQDFRLSLSDQFGAGRPDFSYVARFLYADSVSPAVIPSGGGRLTITGTGFQQGLRVLINGTPATILSLSATQLVIDAPAMLAARAQANQALDLTLSDSRTGGTAGISRVVRYVQLPNQLQVISAPVTLKTGLPSSEPIALRVLSADGLTAVAGASVTFAVATGSAQLGCGGSSCTLLSDAGGLVQLAVTGTAAGPVVITANQANGPGLVLEATDTDPVRSVAFSSSGAYVAQGASISLSLTLNMLQDGSAVADVPVQWSAAPGLILQQVQGISAANGIATANLAISPGTAAGSQTVTACAWATLCSNWTVTVVPAVQWRLLPAATTLAGTAAIGALPPQLTLKVTDATGHALQGAPVYVYQRILASAPPCAEEGRCAVAPVLASSQDTQTSDGGGMVVIPTLTATGEQDTLQLAASTGTDSFLTWSASAAAGGDK